MASSALARQTWPRLTTFCLLIVAVSACDQSPAAPNDPDGVSRGLTPEMIQSGVEGYLTPGPIRHGWIYGRSGRPMAVTYEVQGELAIWEGDIILGRAQHIAKTREALLAPNTAARLGIYIRGNGFRWPGGVVPFVIDGGLDDPERVTDAIAMVEQATAGVTFVARTDEEDFVRFVSGGCSSQIGRVGGAQSIVLGDGCGTGNAAHEILHALALFHEHTRCDRDDFVNIFLENVEDGKDHNFLPACGNDDDEGADHDVYDEGSMMHYSTHGFSKNGLATISSKRGRDADMGQRAALGPTDIATINFLYGANNEPPTADIGPLAASYPEGATISFDGSGSSDPDDAVLTYLWDFGDGTCAVATPPAACTMANPSHTYPQDGSYEVTLTVSDGTLTDDASVTVNVVNVAPTVDAGADGSSLEGSVFTQSGSFTDPGADSWSATVDYGDGSGTQALTLTGKTFQLSHTYVDNGDYVITVRVSDDDTFTDDLVSVAVSNVNPTVEAGSDATVESGQMFMLAGSFSDPGLIDFPWTWTVDWGFGADATGSTNDQSAPITAGVQVCTAGTYSVTLSVTDKDLGLGSDQLTLTVPYVSVDIDITPTSHPNPVRLGRKGLLPVALLGSATFDVLAVDPSKVTLGDEVGTDTPVAMQKKGTYYAKYEDVNKDGYMDLVLQFEVQSLQANGDVIVGSTELSLRGFLNDACTNFRGIDSIVVVP